MEKGKHMVMQFHSLLNRDEDIFVNRIAESFETPQHSHDFIEINYVAEGRGFHYIDEELIAAEKGDVFVLPVGTAHVFRPTAVSPKEPIVIYNCVFQPHTLADWAEAIPMPMRIFEYLSPAKGGAKAAWMKTTDRSGDFHLLFTGMYAEYIRKADGYRTMLCGKLLELLGILDRRLFGTEETRWQDPLFEEILNIIHMRCGESQFTIGELTESLNVTSGYVQRMFRRYFGVTFLTYLQNARIERSCRLLRETSFKVAYIAELCGYQDLKFFYRIFKRKTGSTPHQYRLKHRRS
ncbi:AraC family transcriptional regulator [Paenibacillus sp. VCA1]|uniref:AraC family transcriptional regulator n=1 Tax=Paenibacillus sp. VCA1 TaxID=3039148 RepID=UPI002871181A|nr:AraC family transcriptional regulator [Paenibacillus sp. VCA1]MDR9856159.1 AraC family transcriptional regulator [Paenibacillus sp. VCA1]